MADFPEFDPETMAQAIKMYIINRQNVSAESELNHPDFFEVIRGIAEGIGAVTNPSFAHLASNDETLFALVGSGGGGTGTTPTLLYQTQGVVEEGHWVTQVSDDTVAKADANDFSDGPVVGVVVEIPSAGFARVQTSGDYTYNANSPVSFVPFTPDSTYYASSTVTGEIELQPSPAVGGFVQELGFAKTSYQFVINIQEPTQV